LYELSAQITDEEHEQAFDPTVVGDAEYDDYNLAPALLEGDLDRKVLQQARGGVSKKKIIEVGSYTREDGTQVQAHERVIEGVKDTDFGRAATIAGTAVLAGTALAAWRVPALRSGLGSSTRSFKEFTSAFSEPILSNRVAVPVSQRLDDAPKMEQTSDPTPLSDDLISSLTGKSKKQTLAKVEDEFIQNPFESSAIIDDSGNIQAATQGDDFMVGHTDDVAERMKNKEFAGMTLTHNHPAHHYSWSGSQDRFASGPLSPGDIQAKLTARHAETRAVGAEGTYKMRMDPNISKGRETQIRGDVNEITQAMFNDWQKRGWVDYDGQTVQYNDWLSTSDSMHTAMSMLARRHSDVFSYEFTPARRSPTTYQPTFDRTLWDSMVGRDYSGLRQYMQQTQDPTTIRDFIPSIVTAGVVGESTRQVTQE
jgi:hypothetical protein